MEVRTLNMENLEEIITVDQNITGKNHAKYFEDHFQAQIMLNQEDLMFGAFEDNKILGFLLASIKQLAFGQHQKIAYLEMIEVIPEHQKKGVGTILMDHFQKSIHKVGINRVITLVNWKDVHLLSFFQDQGMKKGEMIQLEITY